MANQRNRILELTNYIKSQGIVINIGKNKARGNKGFFKAVNNNYRIDIAENMSEEAILRTLVHEFAHFFHYKKDKTLKKLDFILPNLTDEIHEELISLTVDSIPKDTIKPLFDLKKELENDLKTTINPLKKNLRQKQIKSINSKMQRLNRYYNSFTELFARSIEIYILDKEKFSQKAPALEIIYNNEIAKDKNTLLSDFIKIYENTK